MAEPLVSVVIPAHHAQRYLGAAIESVLTQTREADEIVVVDDGSTDATADVVRSFGDRVLYVFQEQGGAAAARNHGAEVARGDVLAFLDSDDLWAPSKLAIQLRAMATEPHPEVVFGHIRQFVSPDLPEAERSRIHCPDALQPGLTPTTMLVTRAAFERVGGFDTQVAAGEALDWIIRARGLGVREAMVPQQVSARRLHGNNYMRRNGREVRAYASMLKAALDQRRAGARA